jgi:hypothetical protein
MNQQLRNVSGTDAAAAQDARNLALSMVFQYQAAMARGTNAIASTPLGGIPTLSAQITLGRAGLLMLAGGTLVAVAAHHLRKAPQRKIKRRRR